MAGLQPVKRMGIKRLLGIFGLALAIYLAHAALAENDAAPETPAPIADPIAESPTPIPVTPEPTATLVLEPTVMPTLTEMIVVTEPPPATLPPTPASEATLEATEALSPTPLVEETESLPETPTVAPTTAVAASAGTETVTPEAPTLALTDIPATSTHPAPTFAIAGSAAQLSPDATFLAVISAENLADGYQALLTCYADPAVLRGMDITPGDLPLVNVLNGGYQETGQWQIGSAIQSANQAPVSGVLWYITYQVVGIGTASVSCSLQLADAAGQRFDLPPAVFTLESRLPDDETTPDATPALPEVEPTEPTPDLQPSDEPLPEQTQESIAEAASTATPTETPTEPAAPTVRLNGQVTSSIPFAQITITLVGMEQHATATVASGDAFSFDMVPGEYLLIASAPYHLPVTLNVSLPEQALELPPIWLQGGDADGSGAIDMDDVALVIAHYGAAAPFSDLALASTLAGDLDGDHDVDLYDLAIVSASLPRDAR